MHHQILDCSGLCPHCGTPVAFDYAIFHCVNDIGGALVRCDNDSCSSHYFVANIYNPETLNVRSGAEICRIYFDEISEMLFHYGIHYGVLSSVKVFDTNSSGKFHHDIFVHMQNNKLNNIFLDDKFCPLYRCLCGTNLERLSYEALKGHAANIYSVMPTIENAHIKGWLGDADKIVMEIDSTCACGRDYTSIFYTHMFLYGETPSPNMFVLANVIGCTSQEIIGVFSKDNCKSFIHKFALRWNLISGTAFAVTAFIGHQRTESLELHNLWNELHILFPKSRSLLITKTSTRSNYTKKVTEDTSLNQENKYGRNIPLSAKKCTVERSHSKFYAGLIHGLDQVEVVSGSFNYTTGPSMENLVYSSISTADFKSKFLEPLNINKDQDTNDGTVYYHSFGHRKFDNEVISKDVLAKRVLGVS